MNTSLRSAVRRIRDLPDFTMFTMTGKRVFCDGYELADQKKARMRLVVQKKDVSMVKTGALKV